MHSGAEWSGAEQSRKRSYHLDSQSLSTVKDSIAHVLQISMLESEHLRFRNDIIISEPEAFEPQPFGLNDIIKLIIFFFSKADRSKRWSNHRGYEVKFDVP